jgi:hypothetical protein
MTTPSDYYPDLFGGDEDAARLVNDLFYISHLWDDLIDRDKLRTDAEINNAFRLCLIAIPSNPFYQRWAAQLIPLLHNGIVSYEAANAMEKTGDGLLVDMAYQMRNAVGPIGVFVISVTTPDVQARNEKILEFCRRIAATEPLDAYRKEHCHVA